MKNKIMKNISIGNITTIINSILVIFAGYIIGLFTSLGLCLPIDQVQLGSLLSAILFAIFSIINAKYHNSFWDSETDTINIPVTLTDEQIQVIQTFIETITENNTITDIDPAGDYDDC